MKMEPDAGQGLRLEENQRRAWLRLIRTENVGPATFRMLINRFGSAEAALENLPELARKGGARRIRIPAEADIEAEMEAARRMGARFIAIGEPHYPALLVCADNPPPLIAAKGNLDLLRQPMIAVVGARNASLAGIKFAQRLSHELGQAGYVIASGLARGIDTAAHRGSLGSGTVAVLAGGLDRPYPPENDGLFRDICEQGVVLSEMPFGWAPRAQDFPRRNRIVAGLAYGLLVVEAVGLPHQREARQRTGPPRLRRARFAARSAGSRYEPTPEGRRHSRNAVRRHSRDDRPASRPTTSDEQRPEGTSGPRLCAAAGRG